MKCSNTISGPIPMHTDKDIKSKYSHLQEVTASKV